MRQLKLVTDTSSSFLVEQLKHAICLWAFSLYLQVYVGSLIESVLDCDIDTTY